MFRDLGVAEMTERTLTELQEELDHLDLELMDAEDEMDRLLIEDKMAEVICQIDIATEQEKRDDQDRSAGKGER